MRGKATRAQCRSKVTEAPDDLPPPKKFADAITADHAILDKGGESRDGDKVVLIIQDQYTKFLQAYPSVSKNTHETFLAFQKFLGPGTTARHAYTDNSAEFLKALEKLGIDHDTSTPNRSETNGVAESRSPRQRRHFLCFSAEWVARHVVAARSKNLLLPTLHG